MYTVHLPLSIQVSKKKKFYINLNQYRNAHYFTLNKSKVDFKQLVDAQLQQLPVMDRIFVTFDFHPGTKRLTDTANVTSIAEKYLMDALKEAGKITDDNYTIVTGSISLFGSIDPNHPRVTATIYTPDTYHMYIPPNPFGN